MATISVVNMIPNSLSGETFQDSEPNIAVNPRNPLQIAGSAFTRDPANGPNAPIFVSSDGGNTWTLNTIVPSQPNESWMPGTSDITLRFSTNSNYLYAGILQWPGSLQLRVLRTDDFTAATPMTVLVSRGSVDQPYVEAATVMAGPAIGKDRVYVGNNDFAAPSGRTATVEVSLDGAGAAPPAPSNFNSRRIDVRATTGQDAACIRPAVHFDGTIYVAFIGGRAGGEDVVVVRDDAWADSATPFQALVEPAAPAGDGQVGKRIVTGVNAWFGGLLGQERVGGSQLSIAVDPRDSGTVYVAWAEQIGSTWTLRVQRSTDRGQNWSGDLHTVANATNPALAVNSRGVVGFLYQRLTGTAPNDHWETHLELSSDDWATAATDIVLANVPASTPTSVFNPYIGDYDHLLALGKDFYGIFSANNTPNTANFPQGVSFQRNVNLVTQKLLAMDGTTVVSPSIDPFFFKRTELTPATDFYVRDWTDSATSGDTGLEPSTHPWFFVTSDVWNRHTNAPGGFNPQNQPQNEDAQNGSGTAGDNYAFTRISRNAIGAAASVNARFFVSPFGTGSVFAEVGSPAGETVPFAAGDLQVVSSGHAWHLDPTLSNHLCLAVEISTASDPVAAPDLSGRAPGFPTDLAILYDNNKAQRNMGVVAGSSTGEVVFYALVRNAQCFRRDVWLRLTGPSATQKLLRYSLRVVGGKPIKPDGHGNFVVPDLEPGEHRWLAVSVRPSATKAPISPIIVHELFGSTAINGFALTAVALPAMRLAQANLVQHARLAERLAIGFGFEDLESQGKQARALALRGAPQATSYVAFLAKSLESLVRLADGLVEQAGADPFGIAATLRALGVAVKSRDGTKAGPLHATLLNQLDALLTDLQKRAGDATEVLFNVEWQQCILRRSKRLGGLTAGKKLSAEGERFIAAWDARKANADKFPAFIRGILPLLAELLKAGSGLKLDAIEAIKHAAGSPAALQAVHRGVLLELSRLENDG
jgi:hypothetical protein